MSSQIDRSVILRGLRDFVSRWHDKITAWDAHERSTEKRFSQTFWTDFLRQFGVITERVDLFEREAQRATTGGRGWIDVFWSGEFIGETKSIGKDLAVAEKQALDYLAGGSIKKHEWPRYILCSDFETFRLTKLGDHGWTETFPLVELTDHIDQLIFLAGQETVTPQEEEDASIKASAVMASLFTAMVGTDADEGVGEEAPTTPEEEDEQVQQASMFLTRVLFLLYGDDAGLWEEDLFHRFVLDTTPDTLGPLLGSLFEILNTPYRRRPRNLPDLLAKFPHVNGALYADAADGVFFTEAMRDALLDACRFRWTRISPAVFGSMFQTVKSKEARRTAGEHYTTETNILKTLNPLFLDDLQDAADRLCRNVRTTHKELAAFRDAMATDVFLDPACGSGNFLTVAYGRLRDIETQVIVELRRRRGTTDQTLDVGFETKLTIDQFHGIEINWWPAKIAETAMFLVDHQANRKLALAVGNAPDRLPIDITAHIHHHNALTVEWATLIPKAKEGGQTYVFGNPPFLGDTTRDKEQLGELQAAWGGNKQLSRMDYVTGWHAKALTFFSDEDRLGEWAFVTTNSITQGDQVPRLFGPIFAAGWRIKFAHQTFAWSSEVPGAAAVHVVIVGFTKNAAAKQRLFHYTDIKARPQEIDVEIGINANLVDGANVLVEKASRPLAPDVDQVAYGSKPTDDGQFSFGPEEYDTVMADPIAAKYVHPYIGARELLNGQQRWCLWLDGVPGHEIAASPILKARVGAVRDFRAASTAASTRDYPHHHLFRQLAKQSTPYVCIPRHSSETRRYFPVALMESGTIASDAVFQSPDPDGLQFALLSSSTFMAWQKAVGGRIKSDIRFGSTLTWYTFPVPALTAQQRTAIITAGKRVMAARALHPERTLAEHYSRWAMDPALITAHNDLDKAVDIAFGATKRLTTDRKRLQLLFDSYQTLSSPLIPATTTPQRRRRSRRPKD